MPKLQMGYDISTGEIIRTDCFTESAKIPDEALSSSSRRRKKRQQRKKIQQTTKPIVLLPRPEKLELDRDE